MPSSLLDSLEKSRKAREAQRTKILQTPNSITKSVKPRTPTRSSVPANKKGRQTSGSDKDTNTPTERELALERNALRENEARNRNKEIEANKPRDSSIFNQFKDVLASAGPGVLQFGAAVVQEPYHWGRNFVDTVQGKNAADTSGNWWQDVQGVFREYSPLLADISTGVTKTANVVGFGDQENIYNRYRTASDNGGIVAAIVEDIGNVALVAGGVGAIAGKTSRVVGASASDAAVLNTAVGRSRAAIPNRPPKTGAPKPGRPLVNDATATVGRPLSIAESKIARPVVPVVQTGRGLAGMLQRKAELEYGSKNRVTDFVGNADGTGSYSYGSGKTFNSQNVRLRDTPNQRLLDAATTVEKFGDKARKFSLSVDKLDPSTPIITGAAKLLTEGIPIVRKATKPIGQYLGKTELGKMVVAANESRRTAESGRSNVLDSSVIEGQKNAIASQHFLDVELSKLGISDRVERDTYGGVVLNVLDRSRDELLKGYFNEGYYDGTLPKAAQERLLFEYNALIKNPQLRITKEMLELYASYQIPRTANQIGLAPLPQNIRKLINKAIDITDQQIDRRTLAQREANKLLDEQQNVPTVTVRFAPDGRFLEELTPQERLQIPDSEIVEQTIGTVGVPDDVLRAADADGRLHVPYRDTVTTKMRDRMANEKLDLEAQLEPASATRRGLESQLNVSTALSEGMPGPGKDVPFSDSAVARYGSLEEASKAYDNLRAELYELENVRDEFPIGSRAVVDAKIEAIYQQMAADRNFGTRAELDVRAQNQPRISELLTLSKKELYAKASAANIVGRSRMNRTSLAEALAPTEAPGIRADTDAKISAGEESIANIETDFAAPALNVKRITEALEEQAKVVEDTYQATQTGVNFTPEGIWEGDDMGYNPESRLSVSGTTGDSNNYFNLTERPEGTFSEGVLDPAEEFGVSRLDKGDQETLTPSDVIQEDLAFSENVGPADLPGISSIVSDIDGPPIPGTERAKSAAIQSLEQKAVLNERLTIAAREEWIIEQQIAANERQSVNLERSLGSTQQDSLKRVGREGVNAIADAIETANTSGMSVGEWVPNDLGPGGKLTGLLAKITSKYGSGLVRLVEKKAEAMTKEISRKKRIHGEIYDQMSKEDKLILRYEQDIWNKEQFIKSEMPPAQLGRINIGAMAFEQALRQLAFLGERFEDIAYDSDLYYAALAADETSRYVRAIGDSHGLMTGFDAFNAWGTAMSHMDPKLKRFMSEDVKLRVDQAMKDYRTKWNNQMLRLSDEKIAATPAVFRTSLISARRFVAAQLQVAQEYWEKGEYDVAAAIELTVKDSPTSFAAYALDGSLPTPRHIIGGAVNGRSGPYRPGSNSIKIVEAVEAPGVRAENRRKSGNRVNTLREYSRIEAREMSQLAIDNGVRRIATDPKYSSSMLDIIKSRVIEYLENGEGDVITFGQMEEWLGEAGYTIIKNTTDDAVSRPSTKFNPLGPELSVLDEAGTRRGVALNGMGLNLDLDVIPDITERSWRNGFAEFPEVRVMDTKMAAQVASFQKPFNNKHLTAFIDQPTQIWKVATLAWSTAWITYNAIGNALMATFSAGMSPYQIAYNLEQLRRAGSAGDKAAGGSGKWTIAKGLTGSSDFTTDIVPARLGTHGLSWSERQSTMTLGAQDTKMGRILDFLSNPDSGIELRVAGKKVPLINSLGGLTERMYAINEFTDNMFRSAVYLDQLQKKLPEIPKELLNPNNTLRTNLDAAEQAQLTNIGELATKASEEAVKASLNTMGDFTRLTPLERDVVKRIFPFYPWLRHQTAMIYRLPLNNPLRLAFMASLDNIIGQDDDPTFVESLLSGYLVTGSRSGIALKAASPFKFGGLTAFSGSDETDSGSAYSTENVFSSINPVAKLPFTIFGGFNTDGSDISRPISDKNESGWGTGIKNSAASNFIDRFSDGDWRGMANSVGEAGYQMAGQIPQAKGIRDLLLSSPALGGSQLPRYADGKVIEHAENRQQNAVWQQIARAARTPFIPSDFTRPYYQAETRDMTREAEFDEDNRKKPKISTSVVPRARPRPPTYSNTD